MTLGEEKENAIQVLRSQQESALEELRKKNAVAVAGAVEAAQADARVILKAKDEEIKILNQTLEGIRTDADAAAAATVADKKEAAAKCIDSIKDQADRHDSKVRKLKAKLKARLENLKAIIGSDDKAAAADPAAPVENNMIPKRTAREEYVYKPSTLMF